MTESTLDNDNSIIFEFPEFEQENASALIDSLASSISQYTFL